MGNPAEQKRVFFRNFRDISTNATPKISFYCIFINNFPKNFQKNAQNALPHPACAQPKSGREGFSRNLFLLQLRNDDETSSYEKFHGKF